MSTSTHFNSDQTVWKSSKSIQPVKVTSRHAGDVSNLTYRFLETPYRTSRELWSQLLYWSWWIWSVQSWRPSAHTGVTASRHIFCEPLKVQINILLLHISIWTSLAERAWQKCWALREQRGLESREDCHVNSWWRLLIETLSTKVHPQPRWASFRLRICRKSLSSSWRGGKPGRDSQGPAPGLVLRFKQGNPWGLLWNCFSSSQDFRWIN